MRSKGNIFRAVRQIFGHYSSEERAAGRKGRTGSPSYSRQETPGRSSRPWDSDAVQKAASLTASYSPKACKAHEEGQRVFVRVTQGGQSSLVEVSPCRESEFREPTWEDARDALHALRRPGGEHNE